MATKLEHTHLETAHFLKFKKYIPRIDEMDEDTINILLGMGLIQVSTAAEHAMANCSNCVVTSTDTSDLSNGDDVKLATVRVSGYGKNYSAPVTNIKGKTGSLRVQVYERNLGNYYFFVIPNAAYKDIPKTSNIEIPFHLNGTPKRTPSRRVYENWWDYEVESFVEAATATNQPASKTVRGATEKNINETDLFAKLFDLDA